jgi:signal peptidase I
VPFVSTVVTNILIAFFVAIYGKRKGFGRFWLAWILGFIIVGPIPILLFFIIGKPREGRKKRLLIIIFCVVAFFVQAILLETFIAQRNYLVSRDMSPAVELDDRVLVNKFWYHLPFVSPKRGQIVVYKYPMHPERDFCHRLIGLPGDKIEIRSGRVFINDREISEPYVRHQDYFTMLPEILPSDNYFVLGDDRLNAMDSRYFGYVKSDLIHGIVMYRYWPPSRSGWVE